MKLLKKYSPLLLILVFSGFYFFSRMGRDLLNDWDECIYASYTHSMKASGNFLANAFNGHLIFDKPPLYMWLLSAATAFNESEFTFRALSAVAALILIASVYIFTQKHFSRKAAVLASLLVLSSQSIVSHAMLVNTDIFFTLFIFLAAWSWFDSEKRLWLSSLSGLFLGLGVMVKGLGSLQFLAVLLFAAILDRKKDTIKRFIKVFMAFLLVILPWHGVAFFTHPKDFVQVYLFDNVIKRSLYAIENHHEHWYFYFKLLISEFFPWIVFAFIGPIQLYRRVNHIHSWKTFQNVWDKNKLLFTLILLVILPLLSMTRVMTKLSWYAMPLEPFLAILLAFYITVFIRKFSSTTMRGQFGSSILYVIFIIITLLIAIDAFTVVSHNVRYTKPDRNISARNAAILKTQEFSTNKLEYLVPFGERQGRSALPPTEQIAQTWLYGGNACAVYYSQKHVNYEYNPDVFVTKMTTQKGLYLVENGDLHYVTDVKNKEKVFENVEYTIYKNPRTNVHGFLL